MNCLCCGKPLTKDNGLHWHESCIKRFFGTNEIPEIEINKETLELLAKENVAKGLTVPGVQKKISLNLSSSSTTAPKLTLVNYPTGYILKPQVKEFEHLPESEQLIMSMADISGISTVPHALIKNGKDFLYITKRIDRAFNKNGVKKIAMEDFCQLDNRITADKYKGSYERCAKIIDKYSSQPGLDLSELFIRLLFCYIVGNSDMHLKNFSLIENKNGLYQFSPAYDLLPVNVVMPEDKEEMGLALNGKKTKIRKKDFYAFAETCEISKKSADKMIKKVVSLKSKYIKMCNESLLSDSQKEKLTKLIKERCSIFE